MKRALGAILLACSFAAHATAVWDVNFTNLYGSDPAFSLVGQFTTADANINRGVGELITSFSGTITDAYDVSVSFRLVPPGQTVVAGPGLVFVYDDMFFGPTDVAAGWATGDAFDNNGVVIQTASSSINLFSPGIVIASIYSPSGGNVDEFLDGSITLNSITPSVDEPASWLLSFLGFFAFWRRKPKPEITPITPIDPDESFWRDSVTERRVR